MGARRSTLAGRLAVRCWYVLVLLTSLSATVAAYATTDSAASAGEAIYRRGLSSSGAPIEARRDADTTIKGAEVACVNCHQRSGLGGREGRRVIPPVTGRYLFRPRAGSAEDEALPFVEGVHNDRGSYDDATLARAIRDGLDAQGRPLDYLMPRFTIDDKDMVALIDYLKRLDQRRLPGVDDSTLHFATVVTPDADPVKASGMLAVLNQFFVDKNAAPIGATPRLRSSRKMMFMVNRLWRLHVWRLSGPPDSWQKQLERHLAEQPVLAVISGIGGTTWAPVQAFCEHESVPCLFPNVEAPPGDANGNFYSLYFSQGVLLEAGLMANRIVDSGVAGKAVKVVRQVYRAGDVGEVAAGALAEALERRGLRVRSQVIRPDASSQSVAATVRKAETADVLVLWLRPADLTALGRAPTKPAAVLMSGLMGGLEASPLPESWRERTEVAYPVDLPDRRRVRVDYARGWFAIRRIPVVDERVQADTYLACGLLAETLSHMADTFVRDYLVERVEDLLEHRILTGYYPRLALATGQRFASKGGYIVHFPDPQGSRLATDTNWIAP